MGHILNPSRFISGAAATFDSLYESFQALTSVQVSHFVEWFSGSDISSIWTKRNISGSGTFAMDDSIDGGFKILSGSGGDNESGIDFNNKRHYDADGCVILSVIKPTLVASKSRMVGLKNDTTLFYSVPDKAGYWVGASGANTSLYTADGTTLTITNTSLTSSSSSQSVKIQLNGTNARLWVDGVLEVTTTTTIPRSGQKLMPFHYVATGGGGGIATTQISYLECYNTSISIASSLYERLSALTQVMNQRVVENFAGAGLNTARWTANSLAGSPTFAMVDEIDEGFSISTGTTSSAHGTIDFNDKRQYDPADSVMIFPAKKVSASDIRLFLGMASIGNFAGSGHWVLLYAQTGTTTNFAIQTRDGSAQSQTESSIALDTSWHSYKIENGASNNKLYIDGVLEVTKTTNRPTTKCQPIMSVWNQATTTNVESRIRYLEAYNKLTTETSYPSVYEMFQALTTIAKAHFWEWFSGSAISLIWTSGGSGGSNYMADEIDGGLIVHTSATNNTYQYIDFNNKRHFEYDDSEFVIVMKQASVNPVMLLVGFIGAQSEITNALLGTGKNLAMAGKGESTTYFQLYTADGTTQSATDTTISSDLNYHSYKTVLGSANIKLYLDGVLEVTKTTNRPAAKLQPVVSLRTGTSATKVMIIRYFEAYNT